MATRAKPDSLSYEQLLEMISAFQYVPERKCLRLALDCDQGCRDWLASDPVFCSLNHATAAIDRQAQQGPLRGQTVRFLMTKASYQYELLQKIDGDDVVTEVNRLVETIGVDLVLIGIGNAYATALVRLLRPLAPIEWNSFCEHAERYSWKISLVQGGMQSRSGVTAAGFCAEPDRGGVGITEGIDEMHAPKPLSPRGRGLAHAFGAQEYNQHGDNVVNGFVNTEQEEEDQDLYTSGSNTPTASAPVNKSYQWRYKKFGLR